MGKWTLVTAAVLHVALCICAFAATDEPHTIRVGAYENPPKVFTCVDGHVAGMFPDILDYVAGAENWKIEYVHGTWQECLKRLENGEIDLMVDVAFSEERAKKYTYCKESIFVNWGRVYVRKGLEVNSLPALEGKTLAVMKGSIHTEGLEGIKALLRKFQITCNLIEVADYEVVFRLLDEGEADAGVVNRLFGGLHEKNYAVDPTPIIFNPRHLLFALPKGKPLTPRLIDRLDHHVRFLKADRNSIYYRVIEGYTTGMAPEMIHRQLGTDTRKSVPLSDKEKAWVRAHPIIRLGIDPEFAPFEFIDELGLYGGIASGYIDILNDRLGLHMRIVPDLTWNEAVEKAKKGEVDVLPCVGMTAERKKYLLYSRPYITFQRVVIARTESPFFSGLSEISDKTIGVQANSSHEGYLKDHTQIDPERFDTFQDALMALSDGRIDAVVGNLACATYWIRKLNLPNLKVAAAVVGGGEQLHFAVRRDWPELVDIINKGLTSIETEEAEAIRRRWVHVKFVAGLNPRKVIIWIACIVAAASLVTGGVTLWNRVLREEIRRRKAAEDARDGLFHMIVHDLNNPLMGILGYTELMTKDLGKGSPNAGKLLEHAQHIQRSGSEMSSLIRGILDVSKLEAGQMPVSLAPLDAVPLLRTVTEQFMARADAAGIQLSFEPRTDKTAAMADRDLLVRIMQNLISNSIRYAGKGADVKCFVRGDGDSVILGVEDNGPGISAEDQARIFDRFFRAAAVPGTRQYGVGLGLAFCKMAAEAQGGTVSLESEKGRGARFEVRLPVARDTVKVP